MPTHRRNIQPTIASAQFEAILQERIQTLPHSEAGRSFARWLSRYITSQPVTASLERLWSKGYDCREICWGIYLHVFVLLNKQNQVYVNREGLKPIRRWLERLPTELRILARIHPEPFHDAVTAAQASLEKLDGLDVRSGGRPKDEASILHQWLDAYLLAHGDKRHHDKEVAYLLSPSLHPGLSGWKRESNSVTKARQRAVK